MKLLIGSVFIFSLIGCSNRNTNTEFKNFKESFREIKLPLSLNDTTVLDNWPAKDLIDTNDVKKYQLFDSIKSEYPFKNIKDYQCSHVGRFDGEAYISLLYKTYTTEAGDGSPVIILATYTNSGIKIDEVEILWYNPDADPGISERNTLNIINDSSIEVRSTLKIFGLLNKEIVPKKTTEITRRVMILKSGKIKKCKDIVKELFIDNNPKISDDFS